jgi:hypothetical protein
MLKEFEKNLKKLITIFPQLKQGMEVVTAGTLVNVQ